MLLTRSILRQLNHVKLNFMGSYINKVGLNRKFHRSIKVMEALDITKEASELLSIRNKDSIKMQKRNSLRRVKPHTEMDLELGGYDEHDHLDWDQLPKGTCTAYCTAEEYSLSTLIPLLEPYTYHTLTDDVYHIKMTADDDVFLFKDGTFVHWGKTKQKGLDFLNNVIRVDGVEKGKYLEFEKEDFIFYLGDDTMTRMIDDKILIGSIDPLLPKLAYSHGLARSGKLSILENLLDSLLDSMTHYPFYLIAPTPSSAPTSTEITTKLGHSVLLRGILNLQSESFLDTPDFYWSQPDLEHCYNDISKNLDVRPRIQILNVKLDYAYQLANSVGKHIEQNRIEKRDVDLIRLAKFMVIVQTMGLGGYFWFNLST